MEVVGRFVVAQVAEDFQEGAVAAVHGAGAWEGVDAVLAAKGEEVEVAEIAGEWGHGVGWAGVRGVWYIDVNMCGACFFWGNCLRYSRGLSEADGKRLAR